MRIIDNKWGRSIISKKIPKIAAVILFVLIFAIFSVTVGLGFFQAWGTEEKLNIDLSYGYTLVSETEDCPERILNGRCPLVTYSEFMSKFPSNQDYWIRMTINDYASLKLIEDKVVYFNYPNFKKLHMYYKTDSGLVKEIHLERKVTLYPHFMLPEDMAEDTPIIIKANHIVPFYKVTLTDKYNYFKKLNGLAYLLVFSYGVIFAFILLNTVLGYQMNDKHFIYHAFYLLSVLLYDFHSNGILYVVIQKFYPAYYYLAFSTFVAILWFIYQYLDIKKHLPKFRPAFLWGIGINIVMFLVSIAGYGEKLFIVGLMMAIIVPVIIVLAMSRYFINKIHVSKYFIYGVAILGLGEGIYILQQVGLVEQNIFTQYGFTFALTAEATLFTLSILDKIKELQEDNHKYYNIAVTDKLTEIHNRHYLEMNIEETQELCKRYNLPLSVVMFDIDHFKQVNDKYGHGVGDIVLKNLAQMVKKSTRKSDILARWGGEEFMVLMPKAQISHAVEYGEKIRRLIGKNRIHEDIFITISIGVAEWIENEPIEETFKRADRGLYLSKNRGRNKVSAIYEEKNLLSKGAQWSHLFECGHPTIDSEHQNLLILANELLHVQENRQDFTMKLEALVEEIMCHFKSEEEILLSINYPDLDAHKEVHTEINHMALDLVERVKSGEFQSEEVVIKMIQTCIMGHLMTEDIRFFEFIDLEE